MRDRAPGHSDGPARSPSSGFKDIDEIAARHGARWALGKIVHDRSETPERRRAAAAEGARLAIEEDTPSGPDAWLRWMEDPDWSPPRVPRGDRGPTLGGARDEPPEQAPLAGDHSDDGAPEPSAPVLDAAWFEHVRSSIDKLAHAEAVKELARRRGRQIADEAEAALGALKDVPVRARLNLLDFLTITRDAPVVPFVVPRLVPEAALVALYSAPGLGKSLLAEECAIAVATGSTFLGLRTEQRSVLYVDLENSLSTVRERFEAFGVDFARLNGWLHYSHLAEWLSLNTAAGGAALLEAVIELDASLVILDTTMRAVEGKENESDTFNNLYRYALLPLKARRCAVLRLDHTGKDPERGQRGSSAKEGAEDLTFLLEAAGDGRVTLQRKKNRLHLDGSGHLTLQRMADPLRHVIVDGDAAREHKIARAISVLDDAGAAAEVGRASALAILRSATPPWKGRNDVLAEALTRRRHAARLRGEL